MGQLCGTEGFGVRGGGHGHRTLFALCALVIWLGPVGVSAAAEQDDDGWQFAAGRLRLGVMAGGGISTAHELRDAHLLALFPRIGYTLFEQRAFLPGSVEVVGELSYLDVYQYRRSDVLGLAALFKYNFRTGTRLTPFLEGGGGATYGTIAVPETGTNFNFLAQAGAGLHYAVNDRMTLDFRAIFHHLSNANISDQNPSLNSLIFTLGVSYLP